MNSKPITLILVLLIAVLSVLATLATSIASAFNATSVLGLVCLAGLAVVMLPVAAVGGGWIGYQIARARMGAPKTAEQPRQLSADPVHVIAPSLPALSAESTMPDFFSIYRVNDNA